MTSKIVNGSLEKPYPKLMEDRGTVVLFISKYETDPGIVVKVGEWGYLGLKVNNTEVSSYNLKYFEGSIELSNY